MADLETLYRKFINQTCTEQEKEALFALLMNEENDARLQQLMDRVMGEPHADVQIGDQKADQLLSGLLEQLPDRKKKRGKLVTIAGWAAAAVLTGIGVVYFMQHSSSRPDTTSQQAQITKDPSPAVHGAVLTLGDGSKVVLDSLDKGVIANQGGTSVSLTQGGTIAYNAETAATVSYNTLFTPKGRLFHLVLPDGTGVWLNAASSITYPTSFAGTNRSVTLKGEAYFDVKQDATKPFIVQLANNTQVQVLGTTFNINAYENEQAVTTTLITGSVKVNSRILKPGDQASVRSDASMQLMHADTSQVLAWKNGIFNFENADIQSVMKQLERWYDIETQYENGIPVLRFGGKMDRNLSLSNIIRMLEISGVKCRLEGRKLIIRQ